MTDVPPLPDGYEPHELQADYAGPLFIEGQMNAYARAAVEAEREAIIERLCEQITRPLDDGFDGAFDNGIEVGGDMCADAIRARGGEERGNG